MKKYNAPKVKESKGVQILTTIWLVPVLAMIIALWLAFQYYSKIGPTIAISFKSNAGLIANQSQIKLRDVTIGMVTKISLSGDGTGVVVQARMNKEVAEYLNPKAKLWIVHPDVGSHGVSGLDTLLSGSYIKLHGIKEGESQYRFVGLEDPYIDTDAQGKYYLLSAPESYDISDGSNVYYRMIKVGRVERVGISPDGKQVNFTIFVQDEYTKYITKKSQFYSQSNFSMDFSQAKMDFNIASVSQIVHGGISIYTPTQSISSKQETLVTQEQIFPLYKSLSEMKTKHLNTGEEDKIYKFKFAESINKLEIGSPVEFNGFQVGYVTDIESHFNPSSKKIQSTVFAIIHTKAFENTNSKKSGDKVIISLVNGGLKAKLNSSLPMVGAKFIDLVFDKSKSAKIVMDNNSSLFPTAKNIASNNILDEVKKVIVKIEKLKIEELLQSATTVMKSSDVAIKSANIALDSANKVIENVDVTIENLNQPIQLLLTDIENSVLNLNQTINNINRLTENESLQQLPSDMSMAIQELEGTLRTFQTFTQGYSADSTFSAELSATLRELSLAAESIERMSRKLERKPNALLLGDD